MKALSIKQPWASLILERPVHPRYGESKRGIKPVENRSRPWKHKGPLAIHASKSFDEEGLAWIMNNCIARDYVIARDSRELTGGIIGSVNMVDCVTDHNSSYFFGPYGYVFEDPKKCDLIPFKGSQGPFNIDILTLQIEGFNHFGGHYDCTGCGELWPEYHDRCPKCKLIIIPF